MIDLCLGSTYAVLYLTLAVGTARSPGKHSVSSPLWFRKSTKGSSMCTAVPPSLAGVPNVLECTTYTRYPIAIRLVGRRKHILSLRGFWASLAKARALNAADNIRPSLALPPKPLPPRSLLLSLSTRQGTLNDLPGGTASSFEATDAGVLKLITLGQG